MKQFKLKIIGLIAITVLSAKLADAQEWTQSGNSINGISEFEQFGTSISLNEDGTIVAVGTPESGNMVNGVVRVYENQNGNWVQIGSDITGQNIQRVGQSVSLNGNGSILVVGGENLVRIYRNISGTWTQIGEDLTSGGVNNQFGKSVSINNDGTVIAVGAPNNNGAVDDAGLVCTYYNWEGNWFQLGDSIQGETMFEELGNSVDLNYDGSALCVGTGSEVKVYEFISNEWIQLGQTIPSVSSNEEFHKVVAIDGEGKTVIVGTPSANDELGVVRVYEIAEEVWTQIGAAFNGSGDMAFLGNSVDINYSGKIIAMGAPLANLEYGLIKIFRNVDGAWEQIANDLTGNEEFERFGESVELNRDGTIVAAGAPGNSDVNMESGQARIFETPLPFVVDQPVNETEVCPGDQIEFNVSGSNIDTYQWQLSTDNGNNWTDISDDQTYSGSQTATLTITTETGLDNYQYHCVINNAIDSYTSETAILTIDSEHPTIVCQETQVRVANDNSRYVVVGDEFDPDSFTDNCGVLSVANNFNGLSTLDGADLPVGMMTITWLVTDYAGNSTYCSFDVEINTRAGLDKDNSKKISIYPNPNSGLVKIIFSENYEVESITLKNNAGRTVIEKTNVYKNGVTFNLANHPKGAYFITVKTSEGNIVKRFDLR